MNASQTSTTSRLGSGTLRNPWVLVGLVLVPLLIAGAFLVGGWGQRNDLGKVQAAIVNQDEMVTINGQATPLGRQLAVALSERKDDNITWVLTDASGAAKGIESGQYAAVVTIPKNFSKAATSFGGSAAQAEKATIQVQTSPSAAVSDAALARQIAQLATQELSGMLTKTYLENVYVGFNESGTQFTTLSKAAGQLAEGASGLAEGSKKASEGTAELDKGMQALGKGASELKKGTPQLTQGADQIVQGGTQLTQGGTQLSGAGPQLNQGASQLASGTEQLATGADSLATGVKSYTGGTSQVVSGIGALNTGIQQLNKGLQSSAGTAELEKQLASLRTGTQGVASGASGLEQYATGLSGGLSTYQGALQSLAAGEAPQPSTVPGAAEVESSCLADGTDAAVCTQVRQAFEKGFSGGVTQGWQSGLGAAEQGLKGDGSSPSLIATADEMAGVAAKTAAGATQVDSGVGELQTKLPASLKAQQAELATGVGKLATGSQQLTTQSQALVAGGNDLAKGAEQLASGVDQTATGASQLSSGVSEYTTGVGSYVTGTNTYVKGVATYAAGTKTYATGAAQLADGVVQVADKTPELSSGISQLSTGAQKLADGTKQFATGINQGATKVPSYSESERQQLSDVVSSPVQAPENSVVHVGMVPLALLVMALGSWLGAMALFLIVRPVPRDVLGSSEPTWKVMAQAMLPSFGLATGWAVLLTVLGSVAMDTSIGTAFGLFAVLELASLTFVAVNHALAAWLPGPGRLLAVVWAAAAVAVGTTAALPGVFGTVHSLGPVKPALDGLRAVVVGTSLVGSVAALIGWFLVAVTLSAVAFMRARQLSSKQYRAMTALA